MDEGNINVAEEFEVGTDEISVFSLNQTFDESVFDEAESFKLLHAQESNNRPNFPYSIFQYLISCC